MTELPAATWAIVPLRGLEDAKTRLGGELDAEERLELVTSMARRTLAATRDAVTLSGTILVTADPAAADLARDEGARAIVQRLPGLNAALREGRAAAMGAGAQAVLIVPIDLAAIGAAAIDAVVAEARAGVRSGRVVGIVGDRRGEGTNVLYLEPPDVIDPAFGEGSFDLHRRAARAANAPLVVLGGPLTLDVDTPADLVRAELVHAEAPNGSEGRGAA